MKRMINSAAMAASLFISVSLATVANAQTYTPELGGKGGGHFEDDCKTNDDYLIGFNYTAGKALNTITPVCIDQKDGKWNGKEYARRTWGQPAEDIGGNTSGDVFGQATGRFGREWDPVRCKRDQFVTALHVWWDKFGIVHHIEVFCHNVSRRTEFKQTSETAGGEPSHDGSAPCPTGSFAVGMVGGYGALIDRIGLKCAGLGAKQSEEASGGPFVAVAGDQKGHWALSVGYPAKAAAMAAAMKSCGKACKILHENEARCVAVSESKQSHTVWGITSDATLEKAAIGAQDACAKQAPGQCKHVDAKCS